jgi:periplasmic protein TonB
MKANNAIPTAGSSGYGIPRCERCPFPNYTSEAEQSHVSGVVVLRIVVTANGVVKNVRLVKGMGYGLDEKAMETTSTWRLRPALGPDGKPVAITAVVEVTFRLLN